MLRKTLALTFLLAAPLAAHAQAGSGLSTTVSVSPWHEFKSDLDRGGRAGVDAVIAAASFANQLTPSLASGLDVQYTWSDWHFDNPAAFGGAAPWGTVQRFGLAVPFIYGVDRWRFSAAPSVEWAWESNAKMSEALAWGSTFSATRIFSERLVLGLGAGVFSRIEETKVFPFVVVNWQITDRLRVSNPFRAGPAGPAGLELAYALGDGWEAAAGGTWRTYRFRLDETGRYPNGVGEITGMPLFARLSKRLGSTMRLDFYAGASVLNRIKVQDQDGKDVSWDKQGTTPLVGATLSARF